MSFSSELFRGKGPIDEKVYPHLSGCQKFPAIKAKRSSSDNATTSRILLKGLLWLLTGRVADAYVSDNRIYADVQNSTGGYTTVGLSMTDPLVAYVPHADGANYYAAVLFALEAVWKDQYVGFPGAPDFMAALKPVVERLGRDGITASVDEKKELVLLGDELYHWAAYGPNTVPDPEHSRLSTISLIKADELPRPLSGGITWIDLSIFSPATKPLFTPPPVPPAPAAAAPLPRLDLAVLGAFKGKQAKDLHTALSYGERVLCLGPSGTGKTTAARLVARALGRSLIMIEGFQGLLGDSLVGNIKPVVKPDPAYDANMTLLAGLAADLSAHPVYGPLAASLKAAVEGTLKMHPTLPLSDRELVPGPLVQALRQARDRSQPAVLLFFDEITRVNPFELSPLLHFLNDYSKDDLAALGVNTGAEPGPFYKLNVDSTGDVEWAPCDRLAIIAAGNNSAADNVNGLEEALSSRFSTTLYFTYQSVEDETLLLRGRVPGLDERTACLMAEFAAHCRKNAATLRGPLNPRSLLLWAEKAGRESGVNDDRLWELGLMTWGRLVAGEDPDGFLSKTRVASLKVQYDTQAKALIFRAKPRRIA